MKKMLIIIATLILLAGCDTGYEGTVKPLSKDGSIYLINGVGDLGTLSVIDSEGGITNDALSLGKWPNHIFELDGRLYVTNSGNNNVQIINTSTLLSTGSIELTPNSNPMKSAISNRKLYATSWMGAGIDVYDFDADTLFTITVTGVPAENKSGGTNAVTTAANTVFASVNNVTFDEFWNATYGDEYVVVIDALADTVLTSFEAGVNIAGMMIDEAGKLHVLSTGNRGDIGGFVRVFDPSSDDFANYTTIDLGSQPGAFALNSEGMVYVAVSGLNPDWTGFGSLLKYNSLTGSLLNGNDDPVYSTDESGILGICVDGYDRVYASLFSSNELVILEKDTVKTVLTTGNGPQGMVFVKE